MMTTSRIFLNYMCLFSQLTTPPPLPPILADRFNVRMACPKCFLKDAEGMLGSRFRPGVQHQCSKEYLLAQPKNDPNGLWLKIRPSPNKVSVSDSDHGLLETRDVHTSEKP